MARVKDYGSRKDANHGEIMRLFEAAAERGQEGMTGSNRMYRVGVFPEFREKTGKYRFDAYLRDYSPQWEGCVQVYVYAATGIDAKKKAIALVKKRDEYRHG